MNITHSGFVAIVGRPNVGKSTLLNTLIEKKISIISPKPQTTRFQILGIKTIEDAQIIFIDTPGIHYGEKRAMNRYLNRVSLSVLQDADVILFVIESQIFRKEDEDILAQIKKINKPVILILNKIDTCRDKTEMLPIIAKLNERHDFAAIIPLSALKNENISSLIKEIKTQLPEGDLLYPTDAITDKNISFQISEIIREKLIFATEEELPYTTAVSIEQLIQKEKLMEIHAVIWVERDGQKGIVIGKNGEALKKIGTKARYDIEKLINQKVFLRLWVKIKENWTDDEKVMRQFGYE